MSPARTSRSHSIPLPASISSKVMTGVLRGQLHFTGLIVTDSLTESFIALARANGIPVVGVYETMPTPGYDYQSWMLAEVTALQKAVADKVSTEKLK